MNLITLSSEINIITRMCCCCRSYMINTNKR
ncbi:hypothetical protein CoNPh17_CDS0213 [Staphylococcus phage S-CoN_Ph17]|nr:hypothetical protein CoNPh17_CDS0213 [Staphylococcus phage S-CoN_Ph17]